MNVIAKSSVVIATEATTSIACAIAAPTPESQASATSDTPALTTREKSSSMPITTMRPNDSSRVRRKPQMPATADALHFQIRLRSLWISANTVVAPTKSTTALVMVAMRPVFSLAEASSIVFTPSAPVSPRSPESWVIRSSCARSWPMARPAMVITSISSGAIESSE